MPGISPAPAPRCKQTTSTALSQAACFIARPSSCGEGWQCCWENTDCAGPDARAGNYKRFVGQLWKWRFLMQIPVLIQFITMGTGWPRQSTLIAQGGLCSLCCSSLEKGMHSFFMMQPKIFGNCSIHCSLTFQIPLEFSSWHLEFVNNKKIGKVGSSLQH